MALVGVELETLVSEPDTLTTQPPPTKNSFAATVFTLTVAIACSTFELWRQTSSARTAEIGYGQVILHRLACILRDN